jgi:hypothetical protein
MNEVSNMAISIVYQVGDSTVVGTIGTAAGIHTSADMTSVVVGQLARGDKVTVTEIKKDPMLAKTTWGKHSRGWTPITSSGIVVMVPITTNQAPATTPVTTPTVNETQSFTDDEITQTIRTINNEYKMTSDVQFRMKSARSIMGLPHQFINTADPRIKNSGFGRMFTENILMDMPIVSIIPGGPKFLSGKGISKKARADLVNAVVKGLNAPTEMVGNMIDDLTGGKNAKYYSFETQYSEYMMYVNNLTRIMSIYLGLRKNALWGGNKSYGDFNWETKKTEVDGATSLIELLGSHGAVTFYYDKSGTGMNESMSNSTDKSMLDSAMNNASNMAKEAEFIFGVGAGKSVDFMNEALAEQKINTLSENLAGNSNIFSTLWTNLKAGMTTVVSGANMLLPEIWRGHTFSRNYTVDINLVSPYGTPEAFYLNIGVPLCFLLPLVAPRQFGANGFYSPFLVQAFSNGMFNCSLGIVDSMSISRFGTGDSISRKGLPLEVKVSLTFKDMYDAMGVSTAANMTALMNNTPLLDFMANLSAVNLNDPDLVRKMRIFISSKADTITDLPGNVINRIFDAARDNINNSITY